MIPRLRLGLLIAAGIAASAAAGSASATTAYDTSLASPGVYNGSGQPNTGYTVDTENGVEFGLGVLYRYGAAVHPTAGTSTYNVSTGYYGSGWCAGLCSLWNVQYSINLQNTNPQLTLAGITPTLLVQDVTSGHSSSINPFTAFPDNAGWNGTSKDSAALATDIGFQNSENLAFSVFSSLGFDPLAHDTYKVTLSALNAAGASLGSVSETINATPVPASLPLFLTGLGLMGFFAWRRKHKNNSAAMFAA